MIAAFGTIAGQTVRLSLRSGGGPLIGLIFFLAVVSIVPFGVGPDLKLLARIGPAMLWIGALLATLLGLDRLFQDDRDDGSLDLLLLSRAPLEIIVLAKCLGHWLATGLPLVVAAPVLGLLLGIEPEGLGAVTLTLLAGSPGLTLIGAIGAALLTALGPRRPPRRRARPPVYDPGPDLRRQRHGRDDARRLIPAALPDPDRDHAGRHGGRHHRRRRGAPGWPGLTCRVGKALRAHRHAGGGHAALPTSVERGIESISRRV